MRIRQGFVSNSSSTSFCIVGLEIGRDDRLCDLLGIEGYASYGQYEIIDTNLVAFDQYDDNVLIGMDAKKLLENRSIKEGIEKVRKYIEYRYNVDLRSDEIDLLYGEAG